jgi:hypothetical protein
MTDPWWDTPFNRAINVIKGRAKSLPPTSAGRVAGYGTYDKVGDCKKEDHEAKRERGRPRQRWRRRRRPPRK